MIKQLIFAAGVLICLTTDAQNVGIGTSSPNAALDVNATNNGILIPRVALTGTGSASPLSSPVTSTMVYNTATVTNVTPGFYYWNGSAWVRVIDNASLSGATTVSNTSGTNTLSTTVNGVTGTGVNIINSNALGLTGNNLTATINGIGSSAQSLSGLSLSGDVTGTLAGSTVAGIRGIGVAISSLASNNLLQYNGTNWVNVTPASVLGAATTVSNTSSTNTLSTTVNGVTGTGVNIINSHTLGLSGTSVTSTINGVASNSLDLSSLDNNIYNSDGTLTGARTVTMGGNTLNFTGGNIGIGTASPATLFSNTNINTSGSDGNGISAASIAWANNAGGYTEALYNASGAANAEGLAVKMAATGTTNRLLDLSTGPSQGTAGTQVMVVRADGKVGIGAGTPNSSAALDISSTTGGLLLPRMNTAQQNAISPAAAGLVVFNTDCYILTCYNGRQWMQVGGVSPTALTAAATTSTSITATWSSIPQTTNYYLDVSLVSNFSTFVSGYSNLNVGSATSVSITGLSPCTFYYYRVRAGGACSQSSNSNTIQAQTLCASCLQLLATNPSLQNVNGTYSIQPGGSPVSCYCDMTNNGGGWTELNSGLTSISVSKGTASWSGSSVVGNNYGTACGVTPTQYTLSTPAVSFTAVYCLLTRTTSVMQCASITGQTASGWYSGAYAGTNTSNSTCTWSDGIWATGTETNMTGLKLNWVFLSSSSNTSLSYVTQCSDSGDNGAYTMQWFVR
jgi:hypothetical protein